MYVPKALTLSLLLLGSASVMGAAPVTGSHAPPPPPLPVIGERIDDAAAKTLYAQTMAKMREIDIEPYLRYYTFLRFSDRSQTKSYRFAVVERVRDHMGRFVAVNDDGSEGKDAGVKRALVSPVLFLSSVRTDDASYDVTSDGVEIAGDCMADVKLKLVAKTHPESHPVRELWVDRVTYEICRADMLQTLSFVRPEPTVVALELDASGFVKRWSDAHAVHGEFYAVSSVADADPKLFH